MTADAETRLNEIATAILGSYARHGNLQHLEGGTLPSREAIWGVVEDVLRLLFPGFLESPTAASGDFVAVTAARVRSIAARLADEIEKGLRFRSACEGDECRARAERETLDLLSAIPAIRDVLSTDIAAAYDSDPAAKSFEEIILAYPGLQAVAVHRVAHVLYLADVPFVPRVMTEYAHSRTGIDIHPGARIGRRFFIDHGTGVVIGETCVIGENVRIYQGVTLGARTFPRDEGGQLVRGTKRHPDIADDVTIYSGASILGPVRIGSGTVVGGNVWLTQNVPPDTRIVVRTPQQMHVDQMTNDFQI